MYSQHCGVDENIHAKASDPDNPTPSKHANNATNWGSFVSHMLRYRGVGCSRAMGVLDRWVGVVHPSSDDILLEKGMEQVRGQKGPRP